MSILALGTRLVLTLLFLAVLMRLSGKRGLMQTRPVDLLLAFVLGNIGQALVFGRLALPEGFVALGVLIWLHLMLSMASQRFSLVQRIIHGQTITVVKDGRIHSPGMRAAGLHHQQIQCMLHDAGIEHLGAVENIKLAVDGTFSFDRLQRSAVSDMPEQPKCQPEEDEPWLQAA